VASRESVLDQSQVVDRDVLREPVERRARSQPDEFGASGSGVARDRRDDVAK
jgi:hypothetical protein